MIYIPTMEEEEKLKFLADCCKEWISDLDGDDSYEAEKEYNRWSKLLSKVDRYLDKIKKLEHGYNSLHHPISFVRFSKGEFYEYKALVSQAEVQMIEEGL